MFEIAGALPQFTEQPRVLHCNDRLIRKRGDKLDLPFRKRLNPAAAERENPYWLAFAQQWHSEKGANFSQSDRLGYCVFGIDRNIGDVHGAGFEQRAADNAASTRGEGLPPNLINA